MLKLVALAICMPVMSIASEVTFDSLEDPHGFTVSQGRALLGMEVTGSFNIGAESTTNMYQDTSEIEAGARDADLSGGLMRSWDKGMVALNLDYAKYKTFKGEYSAQDFDALSTLFLGSVKPSDNLTLKWTVADSEMLLGVSPADQVNGIGRGKEFDEMVELDGELALGAWYVGLKGRYFDSVSKQFQDTGDDIVRNTLDRVERTAIAYLGYQVNSTTDLYGYVGHQAIRYSETEASTGQLHDSDEHRFGGVINYAVDALQFTGDLYFFSRDFKSPVIGGFSEEWQANLKANYAFSESIALLIGASREFVESNIPGVGGLMISNVFAGGTWLPRSSTLLKAGLQYESLNPDGLKLEVVKTSFNLDIRQSMGPHVSVGLSLEAYAQKPEKTDLAAFDFHGSSAKIYCELDL